ncbi:MAG TPA: hypothetical protein VG166_09790 [Caulobacteraceae bacterium]|nr:hypothetical protein [Caulobacteraceae bacterium]
MRHVFLAAAAVTALAAGAAFASPLEDAKAGLAALDKGENITAIRLFTTAIDSHKLARSDQELAFVKRAEAYLASHQEKSALADANHALDLEPGDGEAASTRDRAQALLTPQPTPAEPVAAKTSMADYDAAVSSYDAEKKAAADAYAKQMSDYDAQVKAENDRHAAELATWQDDVKACKAGMLSKCGDQSPKPTVANIEPAKPLAAKVEPAKTVPKPAPGAAPAAPQKLATQTTAKAPPKSVKKTTPAPEPERPAIY